MCQLKELDVNVMTKLNHIFYICTALLRIQHILEASRGELTIRKIHHENINIVLKEVKRSGTYRVVIDCGYDLLREILERVCIQTKDAVRVLFLPPH